MNRFQIRMAIPSLGLLLFAGCKKAEQHPWTAWPDSSRFGAAWVAISEKDYRIVVPAEQSYACNLLSNAAIVELTAELKAGFSASIAKMAQGKLFLVRGLRDTTTSGQTQPFLLDNEELWIRYSGLGRGPSSIRASPVIVRLPKEPQFVYVSVSLAR